MQCDVMRCDVMSRSLLLATCYPCAPGGGRFWCRSAVAYSAPSCPVRDVRGRYRHHRLGNSL